MYVGTLDDAREKAEKRPRRPDRTRHQARLRSKRPHCGRFFMRVASGMGSSTDSQGSIGLMAAASIGVGGMIGAGIFSILGVVGNVAGSAAWIGFLGAGVLALFCGHSFAKLGAAFPSSGGPVDFLIRGLGNNALTGSLNLVLWMGYILALALYASAFSGYATALIQGVGEHGADAKTLSTAAWLKPAIAVGIVALFLLLNIIGSAAVGKAEGFIVAAKLIILLGFVAVTAFSIKPELLSQSHWEPPAAIAFSLGTAFLAFEGFGLITNAAGDMKDPGKTLPRAIFLSIGVTIAVYLLVVIATFGNLPTQTIVEKKEYALAAAAEPALGNAGFIAMAIAALFSTASAINATLYGGANVSFRVAHERQLPQFLDRTLWEGAKYGLFVTAGLVAVLAATVPLGAIANAGSAVFLIVYAAVCVAHLRLRSTTSASAVPIWIAIIGCIATLVLLMIYLVGNDPTSAVGFGGVLAAGVLVEMIYKKFRGPVTHETDDPEDAPADGSRDNAS
jgi:amino acid transporter